MIETEDVTLSDEALTTLETIKDELGIPSTDTSQDSKIIRQINFASSYIQHLIGYSLKKGTTTETVSGGGHYLVVKNLPVTNVQSITYHNTEVVNYLVDKSDFNKGLIYTKDLWPITAYHCGLTGDLVDNVRVYTVTYDHGYVLPKDATLENPRTLPYDLEQLCMELVFSKHTKSRKHYGIASLKQGKISITYGDYQGSNSSYYGLTPQQQAIINLYKNLYI